MPKVTYWIEICYHGSVPYIGNYLRMGPYASADAAQLELERMRQSDANCNHSMTIVRTLELGNEITPVQAPRKSPSAAGPAAAKVLDGLPLAS
jgi:hypothetical protein